MKIEIKIDVLLILAAIAGLLCFGLPEAVSGPSDNLKHQEDIPSTASPVPASSLPTSTSQNHSQDLEKSLKYIFFLRSFLDSYSL